MFVIKCKPFLLSILVPVLIGFISGMIILPDVGIYSMLQLPPGAPPCICISNRLDHTVCVNGYLIIRYFFIQIRLHSCIFLDLCSAAGIEFFWPIIFFKSQLYTFAFVWILLLICAVTLMIIMFSKVNKISAYLMIPYLIWCIYAAYLNLGVVVLN